MLGVICFVRSLVIPNSRQFLENLRKPKQADADIETTISEIIRDGCPPFPGVFLKYEKSFFLLRIFDLPRDARNRNRLGRSIVARCDTSITENFRQDEKANELETGGGKSDIVQRTPPARLVGHSLVIKCTNFTNASIKPHRVKHRCDENGKINDEFSPSLRVNRALCERAS